MEFVSSCTVMAAECVGRERGCSGTESCLSPAQEVRLDILSGIFSRRLKFQRVVLACMKRLAVSMFGTVVGLKAFLRASSCCTCACLVEMNGFKLDRT